MSRNSATKSGFLNLKDQAIVNMSQNTQVSHQNLQFKDRHASPFYQSQGSGTLRKISAKPSIDVQPINTNLVLENFLPYANINSIKSRGARDNDENNLTTQDNKKESSNIQESEKGDYIRTSSREIEKQNDKSILINGTKNGPTYVTRPVRKELLYVKAVKAHPDAQTKTDPSGSPQSDANETKENSQAAEEGKLEHDKHFDSEISFKASASIWQEKNENQENQDPNEKKEEVMMSPEKKKLEFTLGAFTPESKPQEGQNQKKSEVIEEKNSDKKIHMNNPHKPWDEPPRHDEGSRRSSKLMTPERVQRLQTEGQVQEELAKSYKFIIHNDLRQSKNYKNENSSSSRIRAGLEVIQSQKGPMENQKINNLEEEIIKLRNENRRQGEAIEILIDLVNGSTKTPKNPLDFDHLQNPDLTTTGRQTKYPSQPQIFRSPDIKSERALKISSQGSPKAQYYDLFQSTSKKPAINLYQPGFMEPVIDSNKRSNRPPPLSEEETPNFTNKGLKQTNENPFHVFLSPGRPNSKYPRVNDPTRQEKVYSSPNVSYVEKSQMLPVIPGPKTTKSGTAENNTRNFDAINEINSRKGFSAFRHAGEMLEIPRFDPVPAKESQRNLSINKPPLSGVVSPREAGTMRRGNENEIRRKENNQLPLLPSFGRYITENENMDSLDTRTFGFTNSSRRSGVVASSSENQLSSQVSDPKNKGKILKEVFSLNWKKKSCV